MSLMSRLKKWLAFHGCMGEDCKKVNKLAEVDAVQTLLIATLKKQNKILKERCEHLQAQNMKYHQRLRKMDKMLNTALEKQNQLLKNENEQL